MTTTSYIEISVGQPQVIFQNNSDSEDLFSVDRWNEYGCIDLWTRKEHPGNLITYKHSDNNIEIIHKVMIYLQAIDDNS